MKKDIRKDIKNEQSVHKSFIVVNPIVAKKLLRMGYTIIDLKPHKQKANTTVFVFKPEGDIAEDYETIRNEIGQN